MLHLSITDYEKTLRSLALSSQPVDVVGQVINALLFGSAVNTNHTIGF